MCQQHYRQLRMLYDLFIFSCSIQRKIKAFPVYNGSGIVQLMCLWYAFSSPTTLSSHGSQVPSMKPSVELAQRDAAVQLSCAATDHSDDLQPMSLFDMLNALQVHHQFTVSRSVSHARCICILCFAHCGYDVSFF